ncbi:hypothetical protein [Rubritalea marina]|uniref:hypothetical protein n=1 Tax=Rubritalea marina TaxID=361055 RepID=UPI00035F6241|nr:hypothetical protein [Rubritalea marina]
MKRFLCLSFALIVAVLVGLKVAVSYLVSEDFLVAKIEENLNSRVSIESVDLSLLNFPAKLEIKGFAMTQRDQFAKDGVPASERPEIAKPAVWCDRFFCEVALRELFEGKLRIHSLEVEQAKLHVVMHEDGSNSLAPLFEPVVAAGAKLPPSDTGDVPPKAVPVEEASAGLVTQLDSLRVVDLRLECVLEKSGLMIVGEQVNVSIDDIRVDPQNLEKVNQANAGIRSTLKVVGNAGESDPIANLLLSGDTTTRLFNPKTGAIDPVVSFDIELDEESFLSTHIPTLQRTWGALAVFETFGLKVGELPDAIRFGKSRSLKGQYAQGRAEIEEDVSLMVNDWELSLDAPSWLNMGNNAHDVRAGLWVSKRSTDRFLKNIEGLVPEASLDGENLLRQAVEKELVKDGKLHLELQSLGSLEEPKVRLMTKMPSVENQVKDYAKKKAFDFLRRQLTK